MKEMKASQLKKHIIVVEKIDVSNGDEIGSCSELSKYETKRYTLEELEKNFINNRNAEIVYQSDDYKDATEWQIAHSEIKERRYDSSGDSKYRYVAYIPEGGRTL